MTLDFDIDIDMQDRTQFLKQISHVPASLEPDSEGIQKHASGVYFQEMPIWPLQQAAVIDYVSAQSLGFFKVDFLNNGVYQGVKSMDHLHTLMHKQPNWDLFQDTDIALQLAQVGNNTQLLKKYPPRSIDDLAVFIALIRPGKRHLVGRTWGSIKDEIWKRPHGDEYFFKKSHAYAFAYSIIVQLNLINT